MQDKIKQIFDNAVETHGNVLTRLAHNDQIEHKAIIYDELKQTWNTINNNGYDKQLFLDVCEKVFESK